MRRRVMLDFLTEWIRSTAVLVVDPNELAAAGKQKADRACEEKDLAFAAASLVVALALFETLQRHLGSCLNSAPSPGSRVTLLF